MKSLQRTEPTGAYVAITNMIPALAQPDPKAAYNILRTTFETDRIPAGWLPHFEGFDEVWVYAETTRQAFIRGGAPGEKLRVVPTGVDVETFCPEGPKAQLPECLDGCFVFLSVFDWQARKGWDCLLRAYCHEFAAAENVGLYLKVTRNHGHTLAQVRAQADAILQKYQGSLQSRPKIYIDDSLLSTQDLAALYRTVDAFVLPSRGEGWGLPWLEAMASGLPTIATEGSANAEYMTHAHSLLVPARLVPVASAATAEIPIYKGHKWLEPEHDLLRSAMRRAVRDQGDMETTACRARGDIVDRFAFESVLSRTEAALADCERRIAGESPVEAEDAVRVQLEGELFASHSFANINETIVKEFQSEPNAAFRVDRVINQPTHDIRSVHRHELKNTLQLPRHDAPHVTIRHAFPPNFSRPETGKWIHIQPWEFGVLPIEWVGPLRDDVDEVWAPSQYVRDVYVRSGVPPEKIQVISWGVDEFVYHPDGEAIVLPGVGEDTFVFLFMGGAIARKGFDLVVDAFFAEFSAEEDVCLVVKDLGSNTFYRDSPSRSQLGERSNAPHAPQTIYLDHDMSAGQRASLYRASKCLVAPYRGEGFGLHVLEAMACGVAPIVPQGGPTDEFVTPDDGWHIEAEVVECHHDWRMCGIPTELSPSLDELKQAMRSAFSDPNVCQNKGKAASERVRRDMTWRASTQQMLARCHELARRPDAVDAPIARPPTLTTIVVSDGEPIPLIESLARSEPFSDELMVVIQQPTDELLEICREHHARVYVASGSVNNRRNVGMLKSTSQWLLILDSGQFVADTSFEILRSRLATMTADTPIGVLLSRHGADRGFGWREARLIRNHNRLVHHGPNQLDAWFSLLKQERIADLSDIELSSHGAVSSERAATDDASPFWTGANHHRSGDYFHAECYLHDALNQLPADSVFFAEARRMLFDTLLKIGDPYRAQEHLAVARVHHANDPMWAPLLAEHQSEAPR